MKRQPGNMVLGVFAESRGFGWVVFEGPLAPVDFGTCDARGVSRNRQCVARVSALIGQYSPDALIVRACPEKKRATDGRAARLHADLFLLAQTQSLPVACIGRDQVRACFASEGARNKEEIARVIGRELPLFDRIIPPPRKPWKNVPARMAILDAASLVLTWYQLQTVS